jgi:hypothetical protein
VEIGRVVVPGQSGQKKFLKPHLNRKELGCDGMHLSSQLQQEAQIGGWQSRPALFKKQDSISKITKAERAEGTAQW